MPLPRFENLPVEKRRAILDVAANEFAEHGFDGASFNRIIAAAKLSKGAMYYYFADKADVYGAVMDDVLDRARASVSELPVPDDAAAYWRTLADGMERMGAMLLTDPRLGALARGLYASAGTGATYQRLVARSGAWIEALLDRGQRLGAVRDDVPLELLREAVTGMAVAMDRWITGAMERMPPEELMALGPKVMELVRDLLEPRSRARR
jgi:AcrR family transcriptional regulator